MATDAYSADSALLLPSSSMCVRSDVTGGCAFVPGVAPVADGLSLSTVIASIG